MEKSNQVGSRQGFHIDDDIIEYFTLQYLFLVDTDYGSTFARIHHYFQMAHGRGALASPASVHLLCLSIRNYTIIVVFKRKVPYYYGVEITY